MNLYEILVPTVRNNGTPYRTRYHKVFDAKVQEISGGLTILSPVKGSWISPNNVLFHERMIPVRFIASPDQARKIADFALTYYDQEAILYYRVADEVNLVYPKCKGHDKKSKYKCCDKAGKYNGYGSGPLDFVCPEHCSCHD
jgi:hypothetical protein